MSEHDPVPAGRPVVELDESLLDARLSIPDPLPGSVSRAGLIRTARASGCRVVGVTAPAGYGKSTLLIEWALARIVGSPGCLSTASTMIPRSCSPCWRRPSPGSRRATPT